MKKKELEAFRESILDCRLCDLHQGRTQVVFGMGDPDAKIVCIGEGPGHFEDVRGLPFVGRSGQLLDKILAACGFSREYHVYIANIVKCRPPENRTPLPEERALCLPFLMRQLEIIQPKILILLGATALQGLIDPKAKISLLRGNFLEWNGYLVMPTYHPSALLRQPSLKVQSWEDFKKVVAKYRELVDPLHHSDHC